MATFTLEQRLILACVRTKLDILRIPKLVDRDPDWEVFLRIADKLGLAPLIHAGLRELDGSVEIPKPVKERLRHLYHRETIASLTLREALGPVLKQFHDASLPVVILKGAAMAALVYPSPALRPMADVDLMVQKHDLDRADDLLRSKGFDRRFDAPSGSKLALNTPSRMLYVRPQGFPPVELHHHIVNAHTDVMLYERIAVGELWKRSHSAEIESIDTLVLSHEDLLLHLALHLSKRNQFFGQLRTLRDIGELGKRHGSTIDWNGIVARAESYKVSKYLYYSFRLARELVGADIPSAVLEGLRNRFSRLKLEDAIVSGVARRAIMSHDGFERASRTIHRIGIGLEGADKTREGIALASRLIADAGRARIQQLVASLRNRQRLDRAAQSNLITNQYTAPGSSSNETSPESLAKPQALISPRDTEVAVTYDQGPTDGLGAQLQRIYGIYALARSLNIKYVHTPLARVGYRGLLPLLERRPDADFTDRYNAIFTLPSDDFDLERCQQIKVENLTEIIIEQYRQVAATSGRPVLIQSPCAYGYTDRFPASYLTLRAISPYREYKAAGPVRICIHLRRGDNVFARQDQRFRLLPNSYYLCICETLIRVLNRLGVPFAVRIHTEMPMRPYTLHPGIEGLYFDLTQPSTINPEQFALDDFNAIPNLEIVFNAEPMAALDDFGTADILILSLSSFGYVGGLLNAYGLVVYAPWWHKPVPSWLIANEQGHLDDELVATRIAEHLHNRSRNRVS